LISQWILDHSVQIILLIAALARCWRLTYHSIWFDEAVSLQWASSNPAWTWQKTFTLLEDKHPPAYYLLLHFWLELLQPLDLRGNDAAVRLVGALLGVLTVWGMIVLVERLSGRPVALLAGLLVALSPVLVWYSQELRMFQPATTGIVWAGAFLICAWGEPGRWRRWAWWLGFLLALEFALYSYLFSAFVLPAIGLTILLLWANGNRATKQAHKTGAQGLPASDPSTRDLRSLISDQPPHFLESLFVLTLATLLFLPLAYNAWVINSSEGSPGQPFAGFWPTLWRQLRIFTLWRSDWPEPLATVTLCFFGALILLGLFLPQNKNPGKSAPSVSSASHPDRPWLWLWLGTPLLVGNLLLATSTTIFAEDRYFLFLAPFALWAIARGSVGLGQIRPWLGWGTGVTAVVLLAAALPHLWTPPLYRENWRAAAHYIADYQQASPGLPGAVVAHVDYTRRPLGRYLRPRLSEAELPIFFPFGGVLAPEQVDTQIAPPLQGIVDQGTATLWLVQSHLEGVDDGRLVEGWLNGHFPLVTEQYPTGIKVSGYALQSQFAALPALLPGAHTPAQELAPGLQLAACELLTPILAAQDEQLHPPSGWVHVRLWWQATGSIREDYLATVQMVGPEGVWGERLYRANEALRRWPTSGWSPAVIVRDEVDVNLNPLTPAGEYPILVGVMDSAGQPLEPKVECGWVRVID
jgi:hypothetical protein